MSDNFVKDLINDDSTDVNSPEGREALKALILSKVGKREEVKQVVKESKKASEGHIHAYVSTPTKSGKTMYSCVLEGCNHSINNWIQIIGKRNVCSCGRVMVVGHDRELLCGRCKGNEQD
jgi:hypothetical protein